ncbi:MAG: hypothetical protein HY236_01170, partial [Acidobacteria bacterium]|nr:hypothetical protein [Acidobacteriota bacterium]
KRILEEHYEGIKAWTDYLRSRAENNLVNYSYYGDWVAIDKAPGALVSTFYYYYSAHLVSRMAEILGKSGDAEAYQKLAAEIQAAFHRKFFNPDTGSYGNGAQGANILPLFLELAPKEVRGAVASSLENDIVYGRNTHLTTGILATKYIMPLLTRMGRAELAYELASQTSYPSWGYMIENGATTLWELWQNKTGPSMNSHNHPMFGSVGGWFYQALAGINPDPASPGFERIRIAPQVVRDLHWASGSLQTVRGPVLSSWTRSENSLRLEVTIPTGSEAEIQVPKLGISELAIREGGQVAWSGGKYQAGVPGLTGARETDRAVIFQAGSGHYMFEAGRQ